MDSVFKSGQRGRWSAVIVFIYKSCFQLCPDDHWGRIWRHPGKLRDHDPTIARYTYTSPQQGIMIWGLTSFDSRILLVFTSAHLHLYVDGILRFVCCLFSCATSELRFNKKMPVFMLYDTCIFKLAKDFLSHIGRLISPPSYLGRDGNAIAPLPEYYRFSPEVTGDSLERNTAGHHLRTLYVNVTPDDNLHPGQRW